MSVVRSETFSTGSWSVDWSIGTLGGKVRPYNGQSDTPCWSCNSSGTIETVLPASLPQGSLRFRVAIFKGPDFVSTFPTGPENLTSYSDLFIVREYAVISGNFMPQFVIAVNNEGRLALHRLLNGLFPLACINWSLISDPGVLPLDGTPHGIQVCFTFSSDATQNYMTGGVYVDNTQVLTFTNMFVSCRTLLGDSEPASWRGGELCSGPYNYSSGTPPYVPPSYSADTGSDFVITTMDDIEFDNSAAVINWTGGTARTLTGLSCRRGLFRIVDEVNIPPATDWTVDVSVPSDDPGPAGFLGSHWDGGNTISIPAAGGDWDPETSGFIEQLAGFEGSGLNVTEEPKTPFILSYTVSNGDEHDSIHVRPGDDITITITSGSPQVSGMTLNCNNHLITITGTNFNRDATIVLTGPDGNSVDFTLESITTTRIILNLGSTAIVTGQYCITVT